MLVIWLCPIFSWSQQYTSRLTSHIWAMVSSNTPPASSAPSPTRLTFQALEGQRKSAWFFCRINGAIWGKIGSRVWLLGKQKTYSHSWDTPQMSILYTHSVVLMRCMVIVGPCDFRVMVLPTAPDTSPSTVTGDRNRRMVSSDNGLTWNRLVRSDYTEQKINKKAQHIYCCTWMHVIYSVGGEQWPTVRDEFAEVV